MKSPGPDADETGVPPAGFRYRLEYAVFRAAFAFFAARPLPAALRLGAWIGQLFYLLDFPHRRVALFNLALAFPEKPRAEHRRILRVSCRNLGRLAAEVAQLGKLDTAAIAQRVHIPDPVAWERRLAEAKQTGAVVLTGHFGNWELMAHAHALLGFPVTLVYRPLRNRLVDEAVTALRTRVGTRVLPKKTAARD